MFGQGVPQYYYSLAKEVFAHISSLFLALFNFMECPRVAWCSVGWNIQSATVYIMTFYVVHVHCTLYVLYALIASPRYTSEQPGQFKWLYQYITI